MECTRDVPREIQFRRRPGYRIIHQACTTEWPASHLETRSLHRFWMGLWWIPLLVSQYSTQENSDCRRDIFDVSWPVVFGFAAENCTVVV